VPLILLAPLAAFVVALSSVRTRRSSANVAMLGAVVSLLATLLVGWGLARTTTAFLVRYPYINLPVAFAGPVNFQSFGIDITLRVDHVTVAALVVVELCTIGALAWHSVMGRSEPGPARFHALISALLFSCVGVLVSWDLAELWAFWGLAGGITYLLLAHRWGSDEPARRARVAMALPFLTDLSLLCGIAWLYARYGVQNLNTLIPILHTNPGWTVRSLVVASILLFIGVAGRLALWPFHSWVTQTSVTAPPAASALLQAVWPVVGIVVLYRVMPIFAASNLQTMQNFLYACGAAAVIAPVLALVANEPRRVIALVGSGVAAIGAAVVIHGSEKTNFTFAVAGIACVLAAAPAREAAAFAASAIASTMRTDDLAEMGDALRRLRAASVTLLIASLIIGLSASGALAFAVASRSRLGVVLGDAVLLIAVGVLRVFLAMALGPLRRRRAFEPDRLRKIPNAANTVTYWLALAGAALLIASLIHGWLDFLDGHKHPAPSIGAYAVWAVVAVVGFAAVTVAFLRSKDGALKASARGEAWLEARLNTTWSVFDRFVVAPATDLASRTGDGLAAGDGSLGRAASAAGRLAAATTRAPAVPLVILLAVLLALGLGLIAPGVFR
jgi:NADH:ubiquinone oxidoreductase subunit 5 (subunit L)/multisubunit Na+/H+ antiporter MnhA subunit